MIPAAFARHLDTVVTGLSYDPDGITGNIFVGEYMPPEPNVAVLIDTEPGATNFARTPDESPRLHLIVRAEPFDTVGLRTLCAAIWSALQCLDHSAIAVDTADELFVVGCTGIGGGFASMGRDDLHRPERSGNFDLTVNSPTTHRP